MACLRFVPPLDILVQHRTDEVISEASTTGESCRGAPLPLGLLLANNFERSMQDGNPPRTVAHAGIEAARERIGSNLYSVGFIAFRPRQPRVPADAKELSQPES
jgi:hypothetical protein